MLRFVTVEEHFGSPGFFNGPGQIFAANARNSGVGQAVVDGLAEVGAARVAAMDAAGIDVQLLSLNNPGVEQADPDVAIAVATEANDFLASAVAAYPTRFAALAAVPLPAPEQAAKELRLRVSGQGFKGAIVNGHSRGRYLDDPFFAPFLQELSDLAVPMYLHPTIPPHPVCEASYSGFSPQVNFLLAGPAWGWHVETGLHVIRMVLGGVFDRFPNLQVVIGHLGEGLLSMFHRLNDYLPPNATGLDRKVLDYLRNNIHYTIGGFNYTSTFESLLHEVGADRIMFSVDYPYGSMADGRAFIEGLSLNEEDKAKIAHRNAEKLFRI